MTPDNRKPSPNYDDSCSNNHMGGQTPIFFAPASSFIIGHHKPAQDNISSSLEAMLGATCPPNQMSRGPLQLLDFKEVGAGEGSGDQRVMKRPLIYPNCMNYAAATTGEEVSMEHDQEGDYEGGGAASGGEKKGARRLGYEQVKALELAFELENRLEPERKMRLASQLGLQPRQVAVWFQNRRARWKTKQMERDYNLLKNNFEALKADRDKLLQEKHHLQTKLDRLRGHAMESKQETREEGDQGSPTLASCSLVDDLPTNQQANTAENHLMGKLPSPHQKQENDHSPSSTEYSDNNNNGGATEQSSSMILHQQQASPTTTKALPADDPESYDHHWRLPPPSQLLYKTNIKNEVPWETPGENGSFHMPIDWYW